MSILTFNANANNTRQPFANVAGVNSDRQDRPKAQLWLNVGYDMHGKFIQLPNGGIPLDTMAEAELRGQNEDFIKQRTAQNELLKTLVTEGQKLAPGEEVTLNLTLKMRRVNGQLEIAKDKNEYSVPDLGELLIVKPPAPAQAQQVAAE